MPISQSRKQRPSKVTCSVLSHRLCENLGWDPEPSEDKPVFYNTRSSPWGEQTLGKEEGHSLSK